MREDGVDMVAIEACDVTYRRCGLTLIQRVSLCADRGEVLALLGPPGSGVNTLLLLLAGVLPPDAGRVLIDGVADTTPRWDLRPDPRRLAHGSDQAWATLRSPGTGGITLLDRPTAGLTDGEAAELVHECRRYAAEGECVVLTCDDRACRGAPRRHGRADRCGPVVVVGSTRRCSRSGPADSRCGCILP